MLFMGVGILKSQPNHPIAQLFFLISLCFVAYIISAMGFHAIDSAYRVDYSDFAYIVRIAPSAVPGLFMILCHRVFQEDSKFPIWAIVIIVIQFSLSAASQISFNILENPPMFAEIPIFRDYLFSITGYLVLGVSGTGLYWAIKGWRDDLVERRRILRSQLLSTMGVLIFIVTLSENFIVTTDASFMLSQQVTIIVVAVFGISATLVMSNYEYALASPTSNKVSFDILSVTADTSKALDRESFNFHFVNNRLYANSSLTVSSLAKQLKIPEYRLRSLINKDLGYRNFNALLHAFRIEDICEQLSDIESRNIPINTIALRTGYKNIVSFNTAFRELKGMTPTEYRNKSLS